MLGFLIAGVVALALVLALANVVAHTNPAMLANIIRTTGAIVLGILGLVLLVTGRWAFALPVLALAWGLFNRRPLPGFGPAGTSGHATGPSDDPVSTVRSAYLEMVLNQTSGDMDGRVVQGRFEGQSLSSMTFSTLLDLVEEVADDTDSLALLEVYLDRGHPTWREHVESNPGARRTGASHSGAMSEEEAYEVLGLAAGATATDIRSAHRELMKRIHPDRGGSAFLAAKINQAKDRLLHPE